MDPSCCEPIIRNQPPRERANEFASQPNSRQSPVLPCRKAGGESRRSIFYLAAIFSGLKADFLTSVIKKAMIFSRCARNLRGARKTRLRAEPTWIETKKHPLP
jgi:hypothetical protein